jgi:predicted membrane channel-forming protein YqfA (hemolysin III family)
MSKKNRTADRGWFQSCFGIGAMTAYTMHTIYHTSNTILQESLLIGLLADWLAGCDMADI